MRSLLCLFSLLLALPSAQAASLQAYELEKMLQEVAKQSSVGTPRAINGDILDQGYTVESNQLINHLSVRPAHAEQMRTNPESVRSQLAASVCANHSYRQLLARGAVLVYRFSEYQTNLPIVSERFDKADCGLQ